MLTFYSVMDVLERYLERKIKEEIKGNEKRGKTDKAMNSKM